LALLDLDPTGQGTGEQQPMRPADAVKSLRMMWDKLAETAEEPLSETYVRKAFRQFASKLYLQQTFEDIAVVLCSDMGTPDQCIVTGNLVRKTEGDSIALSSRPARVRLKRRP
jgi:hypothetical protein